MTPVDCHAMEVLLWVADVWLAAWQYLCQVLLCLQTPVVRIMIAASKHAGSNEPACAHASMQPCLITIGMLSQSGAINDITFSPWSQYMMIIIDTV